MTLPQNPATSGAAQAARAAQGSERTILFLLHDFSYLRNFHEPLRRLRRRGYRVVLALPEAAEGEDGGEERAIVRRNLVELRFVPTRRDDPWSALTDWVRPARMYAHFLHPRYDGAAYLRQRAAARIAAPVRSLVEAPLFRRRPRLLDRLLSGLEAVVPAWPRALEAIRAVAPDAVLVSPLLYSNTYYQNDYVKAAHALGVPVAVPVFSWDNLTNKGALQVLPDRLFVWNGTQVEEAVEIHRVPRALVTATGGMRFTQFFDQQPRTGRADYLAGLGLDPARGLVTYLGSSHTIAPEEHLFARRWLQALRASEDPRLAGCNVLIRPHPSNSRIWQADDFADLGPVALSPPKRNNVDGVIDASLHSVAVIGINTTAMLEAGALDRPLFTILDPQIRQGQVETLHFHYLTEVAGGLVTTAADFGEHLAQLGALLDGDASYREKSRRFTEAFLRAPTPDRSPVEVFVDQVDDFVRAGRKRRRLPLWAPLVRRVATPRLLSLRPDGLLRRRGPATGGGG